MNPPTVLVIEDLDSDFEMLSRRLAKESARIGVTRLRSHEEALGWLASAEPRPSLIVLDLLLPDGDGVEILEALKGDTRTHGIPLIVWSGSVDPAVPAACQRQGADAFIRKDTDGPGTEEGFDSMITHWVHRLRNDYG